MAHRATDDAAQPPSPFLPSRTDDEALRLTTQRLRSLIDHLQSGILVEDEHRNIVHVNREFCKIFGIPIPPEQMVGLNCSQAAEQSKHMFSDPESFVARITKLLADRALAKNDEMTLVDGRYLERDYVPILLDDQFRGHYWHYRDVTERMRAQAEISALNKALEQRVAELAAANAELERLGRAREQLVHTVSHELGNALSPIKLHLAVLRKVAPGTEGSRERKAMEVMDRSVDRLSLLVEDLLDASRLQSGRLSVHVRPVDLGRLVEEAAEALAERAQQQGVTLELDVARGLELQADARRVVQVMFNLVGNALKFTPQGGTVAISAARDGDQAVVRVADTGAGIPRAALEELFQPFKQAHDPATGPKGTGLGLFICRGIVEQHGGRIWVESDGPGKGATFGFALPIAARATAGPAAKAAAAEGPQAQRRGT